VVDGENTPDITFEDADLPIGGLRTWPPIRHNPSDKPKHIRKLTNLKDIIRKELKHTKKRRQPRASSGDSYKKQETQE
jgi:hypothetical protein